MEDLQGRYEFQDSGQNTSFAPTRYPVADPSDVATYTTVLDGGRAIGAIYLTDTGAMSVLFFDGSGTQMSNLVTTIADKYSQGVAARDAYAQVTSLPDYSYGDEGTGVLSSLLPTDGGTTAAAAPVDDEPAAQSVASPEPSIELPNGGTIPLAEGVLLYATEDDEGNVIDLVYSDTTDVYLRQADGSWAPVTGDGEDDDPIDGRVIVDVTPEFIRAYDAARASDAPLTDSDLEQYRTSAA